MAQMAFEVTSVGVYAASLASVNLAFRINSLYYVYFWQGTAEGTVLSSVASSGPFSIPNNRILLNFAGHDVSFELGAGVLLSGRTEMKFAVRLRNGSRREAYNVTAGVDAYGVHLSGLRVFGNFTQLNRHATNQVGNTTTSPYHDIVQRLFNLPQNYSPTSA